MPPVFPPGDFIVSRLARIPILVSARERAASVVNRGLEMGGFVLLVLVSLALSLYTYKAG